MKNEWLERELKKRWTPLEGSLWLHDMRSSDWEESAMEHGVTFFNFPASTRLVGGTITCLKIRRGEDIIFRQDLAPFTPGAGDSCVIYLNLDWKSIFNIYNAILDVVEFRHQKKFSYLHNTFIFS